MERNAEGGNKMAQNCSFLKEGKKGGLFSKEEPHKCSVLGTTIPEMRETKYCRGDFFACEIFTNEMKKESK
jgi:hypothetical protein